MGPIIACHGFVPVKGAHKWLSRVAVSHTVRACCAGCFQMLPCAPQALAFEEAGMSPPVAPAERRRFSQTTRNSLAPSPSASPSTRKSQRRWK